MEKLQDDNEKLRDDNDILHYELDTANERISRLEQKVKQIDGDLTKFIDDVCRDLGFYHISPDYPKELMTDVKERIRTIRFDLNH